MIKRGSKTNINIRDQNTIIILSLKLVLMRLLLLPLLSVVMEVVAAVLRLLMINPWRMMMKMKTPSKNALYLLPEIRLTNKAVEFEWVNEMNTIYCRNFYEIILKTTRNVDSTKSFTAELFVFSIFQRIILHLNRIVSERASEHFIHYTANYAAVVV